MPTTPHALFLRAAIQLRPDSFDWRHAATSSLRLQYADRKPTVSAENTKTSTAAAPPAPASSSSASSLSSSLSSSSSTTTDSARRYTIETLKHPQPAQGSVSLLAQRAALRMQYFLLQDSQPLFACPDVDLEHAIHVISDFLEQA